jgi:hypothetical protein
MGTGKLLTFFTVYGSEYVDNREALRQIVQFF